MYNKFLNNIYFPLVKLLTNLMFVFGVLYGTIGVLESVITAIK